jgi:FMN-dependent oxidoreductase (nitrilotriacetate monooxygenase family)
MRDINNLAVWTDLAVLLEKAGFDGIFFADGTQMNTNYKGSSATCVKEGIGIPTLDPSVLISALAQVTEHLGLIFTSSVLQAHPFDFARRMSSLDHWTKGRVGWNIVTSYSENAFRNFGYEGLLDHEERYRWGEEYLDVVYKLWEQSWDDDSFLTDVERSVVSDPTKIHFINHVSKRYKVAGPHLVSPSPQRTPMLFQAGSSSSGRVFGARHAEGVFLIAASPKAAEIVIKDTRALAAAAGRRANDILFLQGLTFIVGSTEEEAWRKDAEVDEYLSMDGQLAHLSAAMGVDLGLFDINTPLVELANQAIGTRSQVETVIRASPLGYVPTIADLGRLTSRSTRVTGTPEQIVARLEEWAVVGVDGFNMINITTPGSFEDFIEHVVPLLRKRGLMQHEYTKGTLREKIFPGGGPFLPESHPARRFHAVPAETAKRPI